AGIVVEIVSVCALQKLVESEIPPDESQGGIDNLVGVRTGQVHYARILQGWLAGREKSSDQRIEHGIVGCATDREVKVWHVQQVAWQDSGKKVVEHHPPVPRSLPTYGCAGNDAAYGKRAIVLAWKSFRQIDSDKSSFRRAYNVGLDRRSNTGGE